MDLLSPRHDCGLRQTSLPATRLYYLLHGDTATCMLGARKNAPRDAARLRSPKGSVVNQVACLLQVQPVQALFRR